MDRTSGQALVETAILAGAMAIGCLIVAGPDGVFVQAIRSLDHFLLAFWSLPIP